MKILMKLFLALILCILFNVVQAYNEGIYCDEPIVLTDTSSNILVPHMDLHRSFIYYSFTPTEEQEGYYNISTCNKTDRDTEITIYKGDCYNLIQVAYSNNACNIQSNLNFYAVFGQTYTFMFYSYSQPNYNFSFIKSYDGLFFQNAIVLTDTSSNIPALHEDLNVKDIYYSFTPTEDQEGLYLVSTCGKTNYDTSIGIYVKNFNNINQIEYSNDICDRQSNAYFYAEYGNIYIFKLINNYRFENYNFSFIKSSGIEGVVNQLPIILTDTSSNILTPHVDLCAKTIYYSFTPTEEQEGYYHLSTCGKTNVDTKIEIYNESSYYSPIARSDDACGWQSNLYFNAEFGQTYIFYIYCLCSTITNYNFSFVKESSPINCFTPVVLLDTSSNVLAPHRSLSSQHIYYSFTPTEEQEGVYQVSTCGKTSENTEISIYTGNCDNLNQIAYSNNVCNKQSNVYFNAEYGQTYIFKLFMKSSNNYYNYSDYNFSFLKSLEGTDCNNTIIIIDTSSNVLAPHRDRFTQTIYYNFTPTEEQEGVYQVSTCGKTSHDTEISIYTGICNNLTRITYSDDVCNRQSTSYFNAEYGQTYTLKLYVKSNYYNDYNNYNFSFVKAPEGLICNNSIIIRDTSSNILAPHRELFEQTIYYNFTPTEEQEGVYQVSTCGKTNQDTKITIYTGSCNNLNQIAFSDNACDLQSNTSFYAEYGRTYIIKLYNQTGQYDYNFSFKKAFEGTYCEASFIISDTLSNILSPHIELNAQNIYYKFIPTEIQEGYYQVSTCGKTNQDTKITIYTGFCENLTQITFSDNACNLQSNVLFYAEYGKTYILKLSVQSIDNYNFSFNNAYEGTYCNSTLNISDTSSNILVPHEDLHVEAVYYSFTPSEEQEGVYKVSTCGKTYYDTKLTIYSGICGNLNQIAYSDNDCYMQSNVYFYAEYGQTYTFKWINQSINNYNFSFTKSLEGAHCQLPIQITDTSSNILVPHEDLNTRTTYYSFIPTQEQSGFYKISTCDKTYENTKITIYQGQCDNLVLYDYADNNCGFQSDGIFFFQYGYTYILEWNNQNRIYNYSFSFTEIPRGILCDSPILINDTSSNIIVPHEDLNFQTIYYSFSPTEEQDGFYQVSTCEKTNQDTKITIYTEYCYSLNNIIFSDNECNLQSNLYFHANYGMTYIIECYNQTGNNNYNFSFTKAHEGIFCQSPIEITDTSSNILAPHGNLLTQNIYYSFTPTEEQEGIYQLTTCGKTNQNTVLKIYSSDCSNSNLITESSNDCYTQSQAYFYAENGISYIFLWISNNENNNYYFSFIKAPKGIECNSPIELIDTSSNVIAPHEDLHSQIIYYSFTPTEEQEGYYQVSTCGKTMQNTKLTIYSGTCDNFIQIDDSDNYCSFQSNIYFYAEYGQTYTLKCNNLSGKNNYNFLFIKAHDGVYCSNPVLLTDTSSNILTFYKKINVNTIYYSFTPTEQQEGYYNLSTCSKTNMDTYIAIYSNGCDNQIPIAYSDNNCIFQSNVYFYAEYGLTYTFEWKNLTGINNFNWSFTLSGSPNYITSIKFNPNLLILNLNQEEYLNINKFPNNAAYNLLTFTSSNTDIATVDQNTGKVKGIGTGFTYVIATLTTPNVTIIDSCIIYVDPTLVTGIELNPTTLSIEGTQTVTLEARIIPENASNTNINWESNRTDIAIVNTNGQVRGIREGIAIITATTEDGNFTAYSTVTVLSNDFGINEAKILEPCHIYPNPTSKNLNIESSILIKNISIYNIDGKFLETKIINTLNVEIDMIQYQSGTYLFVIEFADNNILRKTVIKE